MTALYFGMLPKLMTILFYIVFLMYTSYGIKKNIVLVYFLDKKKKKLN